MAVTTDMLSFVFQDVLPYGPRMSERVMSGKVAFLPSQVEPQTPYVALLLALYDPLFQSIKNCVTSRATIYVQRGCICKGFWHSRF
jgi:hypothetical protein